MRPYKVQQWRKYDISSPRRCVNKYDGCLRCDKELWRQKRDRKRTLDVKLGRVIKEEVQLSFG